MPTPQAITTRLSVNNTLLNKTTGSNNLALGQNAGKNLTAGNNNIYLSNVGAVTESATIRIGNATNHSRTFIAGVRGKSTGTRNAVAVVIDSNGQLGTINSSERFKKDIQDMNIASRRLLQLRPVTYHYKEPADDGTNPLEYGLIAEEVAKVYPDLVAYDADGNIETVQYHKLTPMLVNEVQHLNELLKTEKNKNAAQTQVNHAQEQEIKISETANGAIANTSTTNRRVDFPPIAHRSEPITWIGGALVLRLSCFDRHVMDRRAGLNKILLRLNLMTRKITQRLATLDPEQDFQEIVYLLQCYEFPWDYERALEFALFRTYAVPSISALLYKTGEFISRSAETL